MRKFEEKTVLITGAGAGMGRASAQKFAKEGAFIVAIDLNEDAASETIELVKKEGGNGLAVKCNVAIESEMQHVVNEVLKQRDTIDVLFNNAGVAMESINTEEVSETLVNKILDVNVKGVFWGCKAVIPVMKKQSSGVIINTASMTGVRPRPGLNMYGASKAAVIALTQGISLEVANYGIRVVGINPVAADTGLLKVFIGEDKSYEEGAENFVSTIPMGRLSTPDDVANTALFLASDEAYMITGSLIDVDGGRGV